MAKLPTWLVESTPPPGTAPDRGTIWLYIRWWHPSYWRMVWQEMQGTGWRKPLLWTQAMRHTMRRARLDEGARHGL